MLPTSHPQQFYEYPASSSGTFYPSSSHGSLSFLAADPADVNAPEMLNHNIKTAFQFVDVIARLAKSGLDGIERAFDPAAESSPISSSGEQLQLRGSSVLFLMHHLHKLADLTSLRQYLDMFTAHLVNSGVGALPMLAFPADGSVPTLPTEADLLEETTKAVNVMYARQKQIQENNAVVASLLSAPDGSRR